MENVVANPKEQPRGPFASGIKIGPMRQSLAEAYTGVAARPNFLREMQPRIQP